MSRHLAFVLMTVVVGASPLEGGTLRFTLTEAIDRARSTSAKLGQLSAYRDAAVAGVTEAESATRPAVGLRASYSRRSDVPEFRIATPDVGETTIYPNMPNAYSARMAIGYPLYTGGRVRSTIDAARRGEEAARLDVEAGAVDLALETAVAYWGLVTAREAERVLREGQASYDAHLESVRHRLEVGLAARNELLAAQVERDRAELARIQASSAAEIAGANLARLLDLGPGEAVETVSPLEGPKEAPVELEVLVAEALAKRPDRAALARRLAVAEAQIGVAHSDRLPHAVASAGYDYANPNLRFFPPTSDWEGSWDLTLGMTFRVFDGGQARGAEAGAGANARALALQAQDLDRIIRLEVTRRRLEVEDAGTAVRVAERNLEAARENRRVAHDRYEAGVIPSSEALDAETLLLRAGLDRTASLAALNLARAALDRALGR